MAANTFFLHPRKESGDYGINVQPLDEKGTVTLDFISDGVEVTLFFKDRQSLYDHLDRIRELALVERAVHWVDSPR